MLLIPLLQPQETPCSHNFPSYLDPNPQYGSEHPLIWSYLSTFPTFKTIPPSGFLCPSSKFLNFIFKCPLYPLLLSEIGLLSRILSRQLLGGSHFLTFLVPLDLLALLKSFSLQTPNYPSSPLSNLHHNLSAYHTLNPPCLSHLKTFGFLLSFLEEFSLGILVAVSSIIPVIIHSDFCI